MVRGPTYALTTAATVRSYSPTALESSEETLTNASGATRATISRARCSWAGFWVDHRKQMANASQPASASSRDLRLELVLVERDEDLADRVDALGDAADALARDERGGLRGVDDAQDVLGRLADDAAEAAHHQQRVLVALGGEQADGRAVVLDHDVRRDRGAVRHEPGETLEQLVGVIAGQRRGRVQAAEEAALEVIAR